MSKDFTEAQIALLLNHVRHDTVIVTYGASDVGTLNVSLECDECGVVILDADLDDPREEE